MPSAEYAEYRVDEIGRDEPDRREDETAKAQQPRKISERYHAGDDSRRGKHDRNLEGGRGDFEIVIARERMVALLLCLFGFLREFLAARRSVKYAASQSRPVAALLLYST